LHEVTLRVIREEVYSDTSARLLWAGRTIGSPVLTPAPGGPPPTSRSGDYLREPIARIADHPINRIRCCLGTSALLRRSAPQLVSLSIRRQSLGNLLRLGLAPGQKSESLSSRQIDGAGSNDRCEKGPM
jgi:hypothetical protein